jgi:hypothetical protein
MPQLTRRRSPDAPEECWHIFYGDVQVGTIAIRVGVPHDEDPWGWNCGFYPGSHPCECTSGTADSFDEARADFEGAWKIFFRSAPRPIFGRGAIRGIGPSGNMQCGKEARNCRRRSRAPS